MKHILFTAISPLPFQNGITTADEVSPQVYILDPLNVENSHTPNAHAAEEKLGYAVVL